MRIVAGQWRGRTAEIERIEFVGHTDNQPLNSYCQAEYNDLVGLSRARARVLAESVAMNLGLRAEQVQVEGRGDVEPLADNDLPEAGVRNNRIEVRVVRKQALAGAAATAPDLVVHRDATAAREAAQTAARREAAAEPVSKRLKRLTIKSFMDAYTLNMERLQQCCVHVGSTDGDANPVRVPFCARQLFGDLRRKTSAGQVPAP